LGKKCPIPTENEEKNIKANNYYEINKTIIRFSKVEEVIGEMISR